MHFDRSVFSIRLHGKVSIHYVDKINKQLRLTSSFLYLSLSKLEDLKVLKLSTDLLNIVKIDQGQLRLII